MLQNIGYLTHFLYDQSPFGIDFWKIKILP